MRIFLGAFLSPSNQEFYDRLSRQLSRRHSAVLRPIPPASAHVTYAFVPELNEQGLGTLLRAIAAVAARRRAFDVQLGPPTTIQVRGRPRLVCAGFVGGAEQVGGLAADICSALRRIAADVRPSQSPHVSLARFHRRATRRDAEAVAESLCDTGGRTDRVSQIQVIESVLTPTGPVYTIRGEAPLGEASN